MAQPTAFDALKLNGGYLGGMGKGRHRFGGMNAKPTAKPPKKKAAPKMPIDEGEPDAMNADEGAEGEATHKGIGISIGIHHLGPSQMAAMKSMQSKKGRFGG